MKTLSMPLMCSIACRACSATWTVEVSDAPGGSSTLIEMVPWSPAGMNPVGSNGISASDAKKNTVPAAMVANRCRRHHWTRPR